METIVAKRGNGTPTIRELAERIAKESPSLSDLNREELEMVAKAVVVENLTSDLQRKVDVAKIDYPAERATFIKSAGRTRSKHTRAAYTAALARLDAWAATKGLAVLELGPKDADDYCYALSAEGRASASVRLIVAAASAFFTWIERRHDSIRNPFRGSRARPQKKAARGTVVPSEAELAAILAELPPLAQAAAVVMATRGLRVGALPGLSIRGGRFTTTSKGKDISGELPPEALKALKGLGAKPFAKLNATQIADRFRYAVEKIYGEARFTAHDLRHFYAIKQYQADKDIYQLKTLLGHASISVTESYLKGLDLL